MRRSLSQVGFSAVINARFITSCLTISLLISLTYAPTYNERFLTFDFFIHPRLRNKLKKILFTPVSVRITKRNKFQFLHESRKKKNGATVVGLQLDWRVAVVSFRDTSSGP